MDDVHQPEHDQGCAGNISNHYCAAFPAETGQAVAEQPQTMLHLHQTTTYLVGAMLQPLEKYICWCTSRQQTLWLHEQHHKGQQQL